MADRSFVVERASNGRSKCKKSKEKIAKGELRIGSIGPNPFKDDGSLMTTWYKVSPFFQMQLRQRKTTKKVESIDDLQHFEELSSEDQKTVQDALEDFLSQKDQPKPKEKKKKKTAKKRKVAKVEEVDDDGDSKTRVSSSTKAKGKKAKKSKTSTTAKKEKQEPGAAVELLFQGVDSACGPREAAKALLKVAKDLGFNLPDDPIAATEKCGIMLMGSKTDQSLFDFPKALKSLADEMQCPEKVPGAKVKPKRPAPEAKVEANQKLVCCFWELGNYEFKETKDKMRGISFHKICRAIAALEFEVINGAKIAKGKGKVAGIGKKSGEMIDEYLETGKMELLERYKKGDFSKK